MAKIRITLATVCFLGLTLLILFFNASPAAAQEPQPGDWRQHLSCQPDQRVFSGVLYCTGTDEAGGKVHVLIIDLQNPDLAFEYVIPKGLNDNDNEIPNATPEPCLDVNVPDWGGTFGKGCFQPNNPNLYPGMYLEEAAERAKEIHRSPELAAVINADYADPDRTHGPEGLTVVDTARLDGAARCDDDFNAALRPWLGLGKGLDPGTGQIRAEINRLETDSSPLPAWMKTGIGGGPWLIRNGEVIAGSASCRGEKTLYKLEPIENCYKNPKSRTPPLTEGYASTSCRAAPHTAAGISRDGRWLFLVLTTSDQNPGVITRFLKDQLHAYQALKFDGGGSTQMLYNAQPPVKLDNGRPLTNYLAVYASHGDGILLPLASEPVQRVYYQVVAGDETASLELQMRNSGSLSWHPQDGLVLRDNPWLLISPVVEELPLAEVTPPGEIASWDWEINTNGVLIRRFQMYQKGEPFGPELAVVVIKVPEGWTDRREELERRLQEIIDEWEQRGEESLDPLLEQIQELARRELNNFLERILQDLVRAATELVNSLCAQFAFLLGAPLLLLITRRRPPR